MSAQYRIKKHYKCVTRETSYYEWEYMLQKKSWWTFGWIDWKWCSDMEDAAKELEAHKHPKQYQAPTEYFY